MPVPPTVITSRQHPFVARCRELAHGRGAPNEILLDGEHLLQEAIAAGLPILGVLSDDRGQNAASRAVVPDGQRFVGSEDLVSTASPVKSSSGIIAIARWAPRESTALFSARVTLAVGLVGIQDPGNVGGIIRSADALGADAVAVLDGSAHPGGWRALRGAMGSTFRIPVGRGAGGETVAAAKAAGLTVACAVARGGTPLDAVQLRAPLFILTGSEGAGLPDGIAEAADVRVTIPMRPGVDSLNVGVSAALLLWTARERQRPS